MKLPKNQPLWVSVILHLAVLLGLFLVTIVEAFKPKEEPHVFEMFEPPATEVSSPAVAANAPPPPVVPELDLPDVPDLVKPTPAPPRPVQAKPTEVAPPKPKLMSIEDFRRANPLQKPRQQPAQPRREFAAPQIEPPKLVVPSRPSPSNPSPDRLTPQQVSALGSYSAKLRSRIDAAWAKPAGLAGVRLAATVVFDVSPAGGVLNARLSPGSGNAAFDQSVHAAFRKVVSAGATPTGQGHTFTMTFRMSD